MTKSLSAQSGLIKIADELKRQGYTVENIRTKQNIIQYLMFYKAMDNIYGIESSDTFPLDDDIRDFPDSYFHVGRFERRYDKYSLYFGGVEWNADNVIKNLEENIDRLQRHKPDETNVDMKSEFESWKSKIQS